MHRHNRRFLVLAGLMLSAIVGIIAIGVKHDNILFDSPLAIYLPLINKSTQPDDRFVAWNAPCSEVESMGLRVYNTIIDIRQIGVCLHCPNVYIPTFYDCSSLAPFATAGRLFVFGDEPDQFLHLASTYREWYDDCVLLVKKTNFATRVALAGIAQPNPIYNPDGHGLEYLMAIVNAGTEPLYADQLRVHAFPPQDCSGLAGWVTYIESWRDWRDQFMPGVGLALGTFGYPSAPEADPECLLRMQEQLDWLKAQDWLEQWYWWRWSSQYERNMLFRDGGLTPAGEIWLSNALN